MVECVQLKHKVADIGAGVAVYIDEFVFKSNNPGKKIYIQSGLHGGETSQWVLFKLAPVLQQQLQAGEVHIVPYANPTAWLQRTYFSTFGKFSLLDGKDYNRCFTEKRSGDGTGRICDAIMRLATAADFVIDLHTSKSSGVFGIYTKKEYERYINLLGLKYNQYSDDAAIASLRGTFNAALDRAGVPNVTIECGGHNECDEAKIGAVYEGVLNLLRHFELVPGAVVDHQQVYLFEKRMKVFAECSGLVAWDKNLGDEVARAEQLAHIHKAGELLGEQSVTAPVDGVLQVRMPGHIVWEGDIVAEIIPSTDIRKITTQCIERTPQQAHTRV